MKKACAAVLSFLALMLCSPAAAADVEQDPARVAAAVMDRLDAAWNAGDGARFAAEFTEDADVINIFGARFKGRKELTGRMQAIFDGIFKGSAHRARNLEIARSLAPGTVIAVSSSVVAVPAGPLSPETRNRQTFVIVEDGGAWRIRHWHNTTIGEPR